MGSFIIPSGFGGLISPQTIYFDNGIQLSNAPKVRNFKFGDGYKHIMNLSKARRNAAITFTNRPVEDINLIEQYFVFLAGKPIGNLNIFGESWSGRVVSFNKSYNNGAVYGLSANIEQI